MSFETELETTFIEFYYQGDCLEQRIYKHPCPVPQMPRVGEKLHMNFEDLTIQDEHGVTWKVIDLLYIMFDKESQLQTIQIYMEPYKLDSYHNV